MRAFFFAFFALFSFASFADVQPVPPVPPEPPVAPLPPEPPAPPPLPHHLGDDGKSDGHGHGAIAVQMDIDDQGDKDVAILVPFGFFFMVIAVFAIAQVSRFKREQRLHETVRMAIERGLDVDLSGVMPPPRNDRRRGILLLCTGIGICFFFLLADGAEGAGLGLIPALVGAGYLVADRLENKR